MITAVTPLLLVSALSLIAPTAAAEPTMSPAQLAAARPVLSQVWGACGASTPEDKLVATYSKGTLRCGNAAWGYRHIQIRHQGEWAGLAAIEGKNWRDIADMAIAKSMNSPDVHRPMGNGKYCYSGQIYLVDKIRGTIAKTVQPTVIVRQRDNTIITAYPGGACRV
jgi:hypothetical protein